MKGDRVIVRADGGVPVVVRVWKADKDAVYVTDDANLVLLDRGLEAALPIGFPRDDVFRHDPKAEAAAQRRQWSALSHYA